MAKSRRNRVASALSVLAEELPAFVIVYTTDGNTSEVEHRGDRLIVRGLIDWFSSEWEDDGVGEPSDADEEEGEQEKA
jgi:hypothetical protein